MANKKVIVVATGSAQRPSVEAATFRIECPDGTSREHTLTVGSYDVGSGECALRLSGDEGVAPLHARIRVSPGGVTIATIANDDPQHAVVDAAGHAIRAPHHMRLDEPVRIGKHSLILRRPVPMRSGSIPAAAATLPATQPPSLSPTGVASPIASSTADTKPELPAARRAARSRQANATIRSEIRGLTPKKPEDE